MVTRMQRVATFSALPSDRGLRVQIGNKKILLVRDGDAVRAYSSVCPHAQGPLEEGAVCNGRIVCPWHKASFRVSDGALLEPPALDGLVSYPVVVEDDDIFISGHENKEDKPKAPSDARVILVIGAGAAGATAAAALREFGFGGRILLIGREPGLPFERTSLSKFVLAGQMPPGDTPLLLPKEFYEEQSIERIESEVVHFDITQREVAMASGAAIKFHTALIVTGGAPKSVDIPGGALPGVHTLRSREDASAILANVRRGARAVILGSSFIGLEVASSLREQEVRVSVVTPESTTFVRQFGGKIGGAFRSLHEAHGVEFHTKTRAARIEGATRADTVVLEDGSRLPADLVIVGTGVRPVTDFVEGVQRDKDGGLHVDASMRVAENVYAAGDIAAFPTPDGPRVRIEHWRVAQQQARVAAASMLGGDVAYDAAPFFWTYHYGKNFEYLGHANSWDDEMLIGDLDRQDFVAFFINRKKVVAILACGHERFTAAVAERMSRPLEVDEALKALTFSNAN
jgi:apoptosis-inducing factor 3